MGQSIYLTESEKENLTKWLARRAVIGGWTIIGIPSIVLILIGTIRFLNPPTFTYSVEELVAIFILPVGMILAGIWLIGRKRAIRRWFDEPLEEGNGRILSIQPPTESGSTLVVEIVTELGERYETKMGFLGKPDWQAGDEIALIVWKNGRFCPRHFDHIVDVAYLPTPERIQRSRRRIAIWVLGYLLLVGLGIILGTYGNR